MSAERIVIDWRIERITAFLQHGESTDLTKMAEELDMEYDELVAAMDRQACLLGVSWHHLPDDRVLH